MKETRPPPTTAWRFCTSCVGTLLCWALWLILGAALSWQSYVALVKDVTVPDFILRRIEANLAAEKFSVRFGHAHLDPRGGIFLENIELRSNSFAEPLLTSQSIYLKKSFWAILAGYHLPDIIRLEGATLQLPAILSPSGTAEPLLREINADFRFSSDLWSIERLTGRIGNLPISLTGNTAPPRSSHGTPLTSGEITSRYLQYARQAVLLLPELESVEHPTLAVNCTPEEGGGMNLNLDLYADGVHRVGQTPFDLGPLAVSGQWRWDGLNSYPLFLQLSARSMANSQGTATQVRAKFTLVPSKEPSLFSRINGQISAARLRVLDETLEFPLLTGSYRLKENQLALTTVFISRGQILALDGSANLADKTALAHFVGRVEPALVTTMLTRYAPKLEPYFRFGDPVLLDARAVLKAGWIFGGVWSRAQVGRLDSRGVQITSARGRVDVDAELNFLAQEAFVSAGKNEARGSYWMNFRTMNYRFLLNGRLRPAEISGWFGGNWWPDFWSNFAFPLTPPLGDADVQGCWADPRRTTYFGDASTGPVEVMHADFERAHARIFLRPQYVHVLELSGDRAGGTQRATGWFKRSASPDPSGNSELNFDLTGNLDPDSLKKLGGETAVNLLLPFAFTQPPQVHIWGRTGKKDGQVLNDLRFTGEVATPLTYYYFPLEQVAVHGTVKNDVLQLEQIDLRAGGGYGSGQATLTGQAQNRLLHFDFKLHEADLARTIRAAEEFEAARTGIKSESMTDSKFIKKATGGKLDLSLVAQGNPDNPTRLKGDGTLHLTGADLGEINLFGLLSQVLSFSSLKLDAAQSSFQMAEGKVNFPDLRVTGKSALITAKGDYLIDSKSLDFTAHLKPYEETSNPLTAIVGLLINPLTRMFELQLTGPLANPKWNVSFGSSTPKPTDPEKPTEVPPLPSEPGKP